MYRPSDPLYAFLNDMRERARILLDDVFIKHAHQQKRIVEAIIESAWDNIKNLENIIGQSIEFKKLMESIQKSDQELPPRMQEALITIANQGWYIDIWGLSIPSIEALKKALLRGDIEMAEKALFQYFDEKIYVIEDFIIERFEHRAEIIAAAFAAHRRGEYVMSIPVFFSQTDGICKEVAGRNLFIKKNDRPEMAVYVEQFATDRFYAAILQPLAQSFPIDYSEYKRRKIEDFNILNRHMVLHGESIDYGTKSNSLKAISLLNYVTQVLTMHDNE